MRTFTSDRNFGWEKETWDYVQTIYANSGKKILHRDIRKINPLVKYLKKESLWNYTRLFLMKSGQNAGAGSTLYGLGGMTSNNFTLYNSPRWTSFGIVFNGSTQYALGNLPYGAGPFEGYFRVKLATSTGGIIMSNENLAGNNWGPYGYQYYPVAPYNYLSTIRVDGSNSLYQVNRGPFSTTEETQTTFRCLNTGSSSDNRIWANGTELGILAVTATPTTKGTTNGDTYIATRYNAVSSFFNGTISFAMHLETVTTDTQRAAIEALINTL